MPGAPEGVKEQDMQQEDHAGETSTIRSSAHGVKWRLLPSSAADGMAGAHIGTTAKCTTDT